MTITHEGYGAMGACCTGSDAYADDNRKDWRAAKRILSGNNDTFASGPYDLNPPPRGSNPKRPGLFREVEALCEQVRDLSALVQTMHEIMLGGRAHDAAESQSRTIGTVGELLFEVNACKTFIGETKTRLLEIAEVLG